MVKPKYDRVLIKLSGEALAGERGVGIHIPTVQAIAEEIKGFRTDCRLPTFNTWIAECTFFGFTAGPVVVDFFVRAA